MIVVDSSVWIDFFNGVENRQTATLEAIVDREFILVGDLILAEVIQGFPSDRDFRTARRLLGGFAFATMVGRRIAVASANNFRCLRARGVTVRKTADMLIATFCMENGHTLLHKDRDYDVIGAHLPLRTM